ncbi:MAG: hypothetical protein K0R10_207 [Alphaproteobacteria bacterium]|jgi:hypothetical protein|nr:hypothetical protein [Alphaproteobacteria bacterium]
MRLILVSLALCALCLLPALSPLLKFNVPFADILRIPATCLDYAAVLFHELGHVAFRWSYGYPALPALDFRHGGGVTYPFDRNIWILFAFYGVATAAFCWGIGKRVYWFAALVSIFTGLHLILAFNYRHEALCNYMGHATEVLVGVFCIIRAARAEKMGGWPEQYLNMIFGMYVMGRNIILTITAYGVDVAHDADAQTGGHILRDFDQIAAVADMRVQTVALFGLAFTVICALTALAFAIFLPPRERLGTIK